MARRYTIRAKAEFSAAHVLHGYPGACDRIHGHNWVIEAEVECELLDSVGMGVDFLALRELLRRYAADLDHRLLNDLAPFSEVNPTAENVAAWFYRRLAPEVEALAAGRIARLRQITVSEQRDSSVTYRED